MEEDIENLLSNPEDLFKYFNTKGVDLNEIKKRIDSGRSIVRKAYKMTDTEIEAVEFCFWFSYFVERETQDLIAYPEIMLGARPEAINKIIDRLHFGDKISLISDLYTKEPKKDKFLKMLWKVNDLRNSMAHGRFDELKYEGYHLSDVKGQLKIVSDFKNSLLKKG